MAEDRATSRVDAESIHHADFATARRGFDRAQVRSYLLNVSREVERLQAAADDAIAKLAVADARLNEQSRTDPEHLTHLLGEEAARLLNAARDSADARLAKAEAEAAQIRHEADRHALSVRDEAAAYARDTRTSADDYAASRKNEIDLEVARIRESAEAEATVIKANAKDAVAAELDIARTRGRELVAEAQSARERILRDLARRRKQMRVQVEQLRAARDRLVQAHESARSAFDDVERELGAALPQARAAADAAGRRVELEPPPSLSQLEEEIALTRMAGLPVFDTTVDEDSSSEFEPVTEEVPSLEVALGPTSTVKSEDLREESSPLVEGDETPVEPADNASVDALFARIREARTEAVARAHEVLRPESAPAGDDVQEQPGAAPAEAPLIEAPVIEALPAEELPVEEIAADESPAVLDTPDDASDAALIARRDAVADPYEVRLVRVLKRSITDEQNTVQDTIRRSRRRLALADAVGSVTDHVDRYALDVLTVAEELAAAGAAAFDLAGPIAGDAVAKLTHRLLTTSLVEPLRAQIERALADDLAEDERIDRVRSVYREAKLQRADAVARELAVAMFNLGVVEGASAHTGLRWVVDPVRACSPDCHDNSLADAVIAGQPFPTGALHPPSHSRCRCLVVPVRK